MIEAALTETSEAVTLVVAPNTWRHAVEDVTPTLHVHHEVLNPALVRFKDGL